jgi:hypothetical protein
MDNVSLIHSFVESVIASKSTLLANIELRVEPIGDALQLWAKQEGMIASARWIQNTPRITVKDTAQNWSDLHNTLLAHHFLPTQPSATRGFYQYELANVPQGYEVHYTDGLLLLQAWWQYQQQNDLGFLGLLLWSNRTWNPIRAIECEHGMLKIASWGSQINLQPSQRAIWLIKSDYIASAPVHPLPTIPLAQEAAAPSAQKSDNSPTTLLSQISPAKCIGNYLVEAGLLSTAQVDVILSDQAATGLRFGEIVASRGWLKEQTIEYLMKHLIAPQQSVPQLVGNSTEQLPERRPARQKDLSLRSIHERETLVVSMAALDEEMNN